MKSKFTTCLLLFSLIAQNHLAASAEDENSTETNEIIPRKAIEKLDFSVRQALLRAIDKLEREAAAEDYDEVGEEDHSVTSYSTEEPLTQMPANTLTAPSISNTTTTTNSSITANNDATTTSNKDEILEESTNAADVPPTVQFYTAIFDEKHAHEQPLATFIDRSRIWKKTIKKAHTGAPLIANEDTVAHASSTFESNRQTARSVGNLLNSNSAARLNEISGENSDEIKFEIRKTHGPTVAAATPSTTTTTIATTSTTTTAAPRTTRRRPPTTTTTTTTTTPRPTHNEDGENIEVVDKSDIRILEAPLVTAFTVDLDERGAAKNVIPIVDQPKVHRPVPATSGQQLFGGVGPTISKLSVLPANQLPSVPQSEAVYSNVGLVAPTQATSILAAPTTPFTNTAAADNFVTKNSIHTAVAANGNANQEGVSNYLIERQRQLEQQIYQLKLQAQQQQDLILRQLKLLEEQSRLNSLPHPTAQTLPVTTTQNFIQQQQAQSHPQPQPQPQPQQQTATQQQQSQVVNFTIRPSVEFIQPNTATQSTTTFFNTFPVEQQLPLHETNNKFSLSGSSSNYTPNILAVTQQQLPTNDPIQKVFQNLQNLQTPSVSATQPQATNAGISVQIQASNQFKYTPTFSTVQQSPLEVSLFQALPQHNHQQFHHQQQQQQQPQQQQHQPQAQQQSPLVPSFLSQALLEQQQQQQQQPQQQQQAFQQQQQQQQHRSRLFRQEAGTSNFGQKQSISQFPSIQSVIPASILSLQQHQQQQTLDNQNFYRQHLEPQLSSQLQQNAQFYQQQQQQLQPPPALNRGINNFAPTSQNLPFAGRF
ncbi:putative mediator of RNA polymerase II transcription subunit 12 [Anastrepha ludens]|uniref:putative mediator of RNA polymerase II transcription subunit 12 n=1 Tax=Anastrepha ludens TaxID=28586 RepID=UPI0023B0E3FB|nr:putative mediator of RNA polymerase II transcription subunit 12 [Anastrepha ludens]